MSATSFPSLRRMVLLWAVLPSISLVRGAELNSANYTSLGKSGAHNKGLLNSKGEPIALEWTAGEGHLLNTYGKTYNFTDLVSLEGFLYQDDDLSVPDDDFFRFSEENLEASQHALFFARWSISAQSDPEYEALGEDGLFIRQFTGNYDFSCSFDESTCLGTLNRYVLQDMYPNNRPLARLVYFQLVKLAMLHDMANGMHDTMSAAHVYILGNVHDIISSFTRQTSPSKDFICEITKRVVDSLVKAAINTAWANIPLPSPEVVFGHDKLFTAAMQRIGGMSEDKLMFKGWKAGKFNDWFKKLTPEQLDGFGLKDTKPFSYTFPIDSFVKGTFMGFVYEAYDRFGHRMTTTPGFDQGYSKDLLCGGYEGHEADRNNGNIERLKKHLSGYFDEIKRGSREQYRIMIKGRPLKTGGEYPTLLGLIGMSIRWAGEGSIMTTIRDMEPAKAALISEIERKVISDVIRDDGNWAACTNHPDAPNMCKTAKSARDGSSKDLTDAVAGRFCPEPADPTLICSTGRWYHEKFHSHVVPFSPLHAFSSYKSVYYNLTFDEAMTEAYTNYKRVGNNMNTDTRGWILGHVRGGGMRVPFCVSKIYKVTDFGGYVMAHLRPMVQWEFPTLCGDQVVQTTSFMDALSLGVGSKPYVQIEDFGKPAQLFRDRLPRILNRLSPYLSYMQYGALGIQFPLHRDVLNLTTSTAAAHAKDLLLASNPQASKAEIKKAEKAAKLALDKDPRWQLMNRWKVFTGIDSDYETVRAMTEGKNRTEFENNLWFCGEEGKKVHTVFKRERGHIDLGTHPTGRIDSHAVKCRKWMREHHREIVTSGRS